MIKGHLLTRTQAEVIGKALMALHQIGAHANVRLRCKLNVMVHVEEDEDGFVRVYDIEHRQAEHYSGLLAFCICYSLDTETGTMLPVVDKSLVAAIGVVTTYTTDGEF